MYDVRRTLLNRRPPWRWLIASFAGVVRQHVKRLIDSLQLPRSYRVAVPQKVDGISISIDPDGRNILPCIHDNRVAAVVAIVLRINRYGIKLKPCCFTHRCSSHRKPIVCDSIRTLRNHTHQTTNQPNKLTTDPDTQPVIHSLAPLTHSLRCCGPVCGVCRAACVWCGACLPPPPLPCVVCVLPACPCPVSSASPASLASALHVSVRTAISYPLVPGIPIVPSCLSDRAGWPFASSVHLGG